MTAYLTRSKSIAHVREVTGLSKALCSAKVNALPRTQDGAREKILRRDLDKLIADLTKPKPERTIRPLSEKHRKLAAAARAAKSWPDVIS